MLPQHLSTPLLVAAVYFTSNTAGAQKNAVVPIGRAAPDKSLPIFHFNIQAFINIINLCNRLCARALVPGNRPGPHRLLYNRYTDATTYCHRCRLQPPPPPPPTDVCSPSNRLDIAGHLWPDINKIKYIKKGRKKKWNILATLMYTLLRCHKTFVAIKIVAHPARCLVKYFYHLLDFLLLAVHSTPISSTHQALLLNQLWGAATTCKASKRL